MRELLAKDGDHVRPTGTTAAQELAAMERGGHRIRVELSPSQAVLLVANLQTALRHPGSAGPSNENARWLIRQIVGYFKDVPAVLREIELGWEETS